jgi:hypothetical protein
MWVMTRAKATVLIKEDLKTLRFRCVSPVPIPRADAYKIVGQTKSEV